VICPRFRLVKVHVTVSSGLTEMFDTGLPSSHVALDWSHPAGTLSETEYPDPTGTLAIVWVFECAGSASSSRTKLEGDSPPPVVNEKSCGSSGVASLTITIRPRFWLVNVHATFSPGESDTFDTGLPSSQVALDWSQPDGTVSETE